jgi:hypothetical protein
MKNSTLISEEKYSYIIECLRSIKRKGPIKKYWTNDEKTYNLKYCLLTNVQRRCLFRRTKTGDLLQVPTYERIWEIMLKTHQDLAHMRDLRKNKMALDKIYYSIPESCLKQFLALCPICFSARIPMKKSKMNPLKFIFTPRVGHRAQIDLIGMESVSKDGYSYILRYVDHLSGFSHIALLRSKESREVGERLIEIISTCIMPEILQSDNGSEFLGDCIKTLQEFYGNIHIVKGKVRHPQSQGKVEKGHGPFKENLQKWMKEHKGKSWTVGAFVVNGQMNRVPQWNRGGFSAYNMYYGKNCTQKTSVVFGEIAAKHAMSEFGIHCAKIYCLEAKKLAPEREVREKEIVQIMKKGMLLTGC